MISHYMIEVLRRCNGDPMAMRELAPDLYQSALDELEKDGAGARRWVPRSRH